MSSFLKNYIERVFEQIPKENGKVQATYVNVVLRAIGIEGHLTRNMTPDQAVKYIMEQVQHNSTLVNRQAFYTLNDGQSIDRRSLQSISDKHELDLDIDLIFRSTSGRDISYDRYMQLV